MVMPLYFPKRSLKPTTFWVCHYTFTVFYVIQFPCLTAPRLFTKRLKFSSGFGFVSCDALHLDLYLSVLTPLDFSLINQPTAVTRFTLP